MDEYFIKLLIQLNNGYHLNDSEMRDLKNYLKEQLRQIELRKGVK